HGPARQTRRRPRPTNRRPRHAPRRRGKANPHALRRTPLRRTARRSKPLRPRRHRRRNLAHPRTATRSSQPTKPLPTRLLGSTRRRPPPDRTWWLAPTLTSSAAAPCDQTTPHDGARTISY